MGALSCAHKREEEEETLSFVLFPVHCTPSILPLLFLFPFSPPNSFARVEGRRIFPPFLPLFFLSSPSSFLSLTRCLFSLGLLLDQAKNLALIDIDQSKSPIPIHQDKNCVDTFRVNACAKLAASHSRKKNL